MNGELIGLLGQAVINLPVPAEIGVLGDHPEYASMHRRVLRDGGLVLGRVEEGVQVVRVEDRDNDRGVRLEDSGQALPVVFPVQGGAHLEHVTILPLAVQHVHVTGSSPNQQEAKVTDRALLGLEESVPVPAHYTETDVEIGVVRELYAHPLVGDHVRLADRVLGDRHVVEREGETELVVRLGGRLLAVVVGVRGHGGRGRGDGGRERSRQGARRRRERGRRGGVGRRGTRCGREQPQPQPWPGEQHSLLHPPHRRVASSSSPISASEIRRFPDRAREPPWLRRFSFPSLSNRPDLEHATR